MITEIEHPDGTKIVPFEGGWKVEAILEKNKWYKCKEYGNLVFYKSENQDNYGFCFGVSYSEWSDILWFRENYYTWLPASEEEVKEALIKEAERRGCKKGIKIKSAFNDSEHIIRHGVFFYKYNDNIALIDNSQEIGGFIYQNGKWAEISNHNEKILERIATIEKELEQLKAELK